MHLEGALTPAILFTLAKRNNISLPSDDEAFQSPETLLARYDRFTSLDDFLHYYFIGMSVLIHPSDYEDLAMDYFRHASADGVAHAEVFFDPQAHISRGISYNTVLAGFSAARKRAKAEMGISSELICCFLRHLPAPECLDTFNDADVQASFRNGAITGIGLDSSEKPFPPELFKTIYDKAGELGLRRTAHAGEEGPPSFVTSALDVLQVERIDHGIRVAEDEALLERVAKDGTMLSVCPISNVLLRCVPAIKDVPIRRFLDAGIKFSINSDDPAYFGGYILDNYCAVQEAFELSLNEWRGICQAGIDGSWCSQDRKYKLSVKLDEVAKLWSNKIPA